MCGAGKGGELELPRTCGMVRCMARAFALSLCLLCSSCGVLSIGLKPWTEYVLTDGMVITAETPAGPVRIAGKEGTKRIYSGNGWSKTRLLDPRDVRWHGSLGLYDAALSLSPQGRLLIEEGRLFFDSTRDTVRYLRSRAVPPVYNNQGLAVGLKVVDWPGQERKEPVRTIEVWQIYVKGSKPMWLPGAKDDAISVCGGTIPDSASPYPAKIGAALTYD